MPLAEGLCLQLLYWEFKAIPIQYIWSATLNQAWTFMQTQGMGFAVCGHMFWL